MSSKAVEYGQDENGVWVLNGRLVLSHYRHLKSIPGRIDDRCGFCQSDMGKVATFVENTKPAVGVDEGNRSDAVGDSPPASVSEWLGKEA